MKTNYSVQDYFKIIIASLLLFYFSLVNIFAQNKTSDFNELPVIKWTVKTSGSVYSSPVISGERVYFGSNDSTLYSVDINSGKIIKLFRTAGEIRSSVCISGKDLFLNGGDGNLYSLNALTGKIKWKFKTGGEKKYDFADYFHSTPVVNNNIVYFGSGDKYFYALNSSTGKLIWSFRTDGIIHSTPALSNGKIFFGSFDGYVYCLDATNGSLVWKFKTVGHRYFPKGEVQGSPSVYKNLVFIGARDYNVYALDQDAGYCHWNKAFRDGWGLNNNICDSVLYTGSADERVFIASDPKTGKELWNKKMEFLVFGNNAYSENLIYTGTTNGKLHAINKKTGEKVWSYLTETYLNNKSKYFRENDTYRGDIYSIIKSNEQFLEVEEELGGVFTTPVIYKDNLIFSSTNGKVYCLKKP